MNTIYFSTYGHNGGVWLWNCLMELGIRVDHEPHVTFDFDRLVDETSSRYTRHPGYDHFVTTLPSLAQRSSWIFRNDIFIRVTNHQLPPRDTSPRKTILMVRDPRDVLMSVHRWEVAQTGVERAFADCVDQHLCAWIDFHEQLLTYPGVGVFRFEEYKIDPVRCLASVLDFCELTYGADEIARAVEASTIDVARRSEYAYLCVTPLEQRHYPATVNQSGRYQKWRTLAGSEKALRLIASRARKVMQRLGYIDEAGNDVFAPRPHVASAIRLSPVTSPGQTKRAKEAEIETLDIAALNEYVGGLQRSSSLGPGLAAIDRTLALYPDNFALSVLKLDTLFQVIDKEPRYIDAYAGETVRTFYWCANRDAGILQTHGTRMMDVLRRIGNHTQMGALADDMERATADSPTPNLRKPTPVLNVA